MKKALFLVGLTFMGLPNALVNAQEKAEDVQVQVDQSTAVSQECFPVVKKIIKAHFFGIPKRHKAKLFNGVIGLVLGIAGGIGWIVYRNPEDNNLLVEYVAASAVSSWVAGGPVGFASCAGVSGAFLLALKYNLV